MGLRMNRYVKTALLAGAAWSALSTTTLAQDAAPPAEQATAVDDIIVTGSLDATFSLECGRCLQRFQMKVDLSEYEAEVPIEKETTMDLTDLVREDILLTLPNFPRCENGNVDPRACPAEGNFDPTDEPLVNEEPGADGGVWNALDQLK